jgi:hypothetical protein
MNDLTIESVIAGIQDRLGIQQKLISDENVELACLTPVKSYLAGGQTYFYPGAGDPRPPVGADVHLLQEGGICIRGRWIEGDKSMIGWCPLPKRDHEKEAMIKKL